MNIKRSVNSAEMRLSHRKALQDIVAILALIKGTRRKSDRNVCRLKARPSKERKRQNLLAQENLSLTDAAALLDISRLTLYRLLNDRGNAPFRVKKRVKKSDLLNLYQNATEKPAPTNTSIAKISRKQEEYITVAEALQLFKISSTHLYNKIREAHYPKNALQKLFAKKQYADIAEWYTVAEITEKFAENYYLE